MSTSHHKKVPNEARWSDHQVSSDPMMDVSKPIALSQRDTLDVTVGWHGWWAGWWAGIAMDPMDSFKIQWWCDPIYSPVVSYVSYVSFVSYVINQCIANKIAENIAAVQSFNEVSIGSARISANSSESSRPSPLMSAALNSMDLRRTGYRERWPVMSPWISGFSHGV